MNQIPVIKEKKYKIDDFLRDIKPIIKAKNITRFNELLDKVIPIKNTNTPEQKKVIYNQFNISLKKIFMMCLEAGFIESFQVLLSKGIDVNGLIMKNKTPLIFVAQNGYTNSIKELIRLGADINYLGKDVNETPLYVAAKTTFINTVKVLVENGANVNLVVHIDQSPIASALEGWMDASKEKDRKIHIEIIEYLLKNNANPNDKNIFNLFLILYDKNSNQIYKLIYDILFIIKIFIKYGMNYDIQYDIQYNNSTLLYEIIENLYKNIVSIHRGII